MVSYQGINRLEKGARMLEKRDIKSLHHSELSEYMEKANHPKFRVKQIEEWLYVRHCSSFDEMTNLPKQLRGKLQDDFSLDVPRIIDKQVSKDGTRKYLLELSDGTSVETVGIPSLDDRRLTVCFSTQAGCAIGCTFCATGQSGFLRNLSAGEIIDQIYTVAADFDRRITGVVGMGQGEPFLNYDNVLESLRRINDPIGLGIGARHITVSTCGIIDNILRFADEPEQFTLAISLHSAIQSTRDQIMPGVKKFPLAELHDAIVKYTEKTNRRPTFEYAPIAHLNDDEEHVEALIEFCRGLLCHVNLIPLNSIEVNQQNYLFIQKPSTKLHTIEHNLLDAGIECSIRKSRGSDIDGACGQLRQRHIRK